MVKDSFDRKLSTIESGGSAIAGRYWAAHGDTFPRIQGQW